MPIKIADNLPAAKVLESENIFVMTEERALHQDIRPLKILLLNLMPTKIETETQFLRLLSNSPLQVDVTLMQTASHVPTHISKEHLLQFYQTFDQLKNNRYDGMIITGAPIENLAFEDVDYWPELEKIMDWSQTHVYSTLHICWGAQAGLFHHYGVPKCPLPKKLSGIFPHTPADARHPLLHGFDDVFYMPHSRYTEVRRKDIEQHPELMVLASSGEAGAAILADRDGRRFYITGHFEYDRLTLAGEYARDVKKAIDPPVPAHYFPGDDPKNNPPMLWGAHANLLFSNWLNYFVYQKTPFDLSAL